MNKHLFKTIEDCQSEEYFHGSAPKQIALQVWDLVHGLCSLYSTTRLQKVSEMNEMSTKLESLLEVAFDAFVQHVELTKN